MSWSRRTFLATSSLALVAGALPAPLRGLGLRADRFTPLRGNVGMYENRGGVMGWLVTPDGVAVVDSQFADTAETFLAGLRARSERTIDLLLNTHHHGDHVGGNAVLRPAVGRVVAHEHAAQLLRDNANFPAEGLPDLTFGSTWSERLGGETITARHYGTGAHTGGDATIAFEESNIVHMGDLMFHRTYPFIDGPSGASVRGWIGLLETVVADRDADTLFVFGHAGEGAPLTGGSAELLLQRDFLGAALEVVEAGVRAGRSIDEIAESGPPPGFPDHDGPANRLATLYRVAYPEVAS